jgi:uncharacterized protein YjbI with pentapeptide repeats
VLFTTTHNQSKHHTPEIFKLWFGQNISESTEKMIETFRRNKNHNQTDLSGADLSKAKLFRAKLSGANLVRANLSEADLRSAKLLNTVIINPKFSNVLVDTYTDFSNSIIDDPDFLKYLHEKGCQNISNEIKNKQELREELLRRNFSQQTINFYLRISQLPGQ